MEGPTPVSAMIHAAAMVSAGIFLLLRFFPLLQATGIPGPESTIIGLIGAFTAFMGATIAVAQYDIKRVLAFSTISQLGFMVAAIGTGAYIAAAFHLLTHAFFKALLFLGSGSVIHGVEHGHHHVHGHAHGNGHDDAHGAHGEETHGHPAAGGHDAPQTAGAALAVAHDAKDAHDAHAEPSTGSGHVEEFDPQDMRNMGGLRKKMPITFITFLIGGLALAGFPFITAGFWSKDEIFADAWHAFSAEGHLLAGIVFFTLAFTALLTAFYTMRQIALIFFGKPRTEAAGHASESSPAMTIPLIVLAFFALTIGFVNIPSDFPIFGSIAGEFSYYLKDLLKQSLIEKPETLEFNIVPVTFSVVVSLLGLTLGFLVYRGRRLEAGVTDPVEKLGGLFRFLQNRWYWDELYRKIFINPLQKIADAYSRIIDQGIIDKILEGVYRLGGAIAGAFAAFDRVVITGISDTVGRVFRIAGDWGRELQSGQVQNYLLSGLIMALAILVFFLFFFQ
jgi:NADH-quinone oxidoreductase subunit L